MKEINQIDELDTHADTTETAEYAAYVAALIAEAKADGTYIPAANAEQETKKD